VVIRVDAAGICGSDGKCHSGADMFWGGEEPYVKAPVIPGHEFVGTVVELGPHAAELHGLDLGDRAIAEQINPCGQCRYCCDGSYWMCEVHDIYGFQRKVADGAWAQYMRFGPRSRVHMVPVDMPPEVGVLIEPLACALHATDRADVQMGDIVLIAGAGPIGLLILSAVRRRGPGTVVVTDARPERLKVARRLGADVTVDVRIEDPAMVVRSLSDGYGCDVAIEASGHPDAVRQSLDAVRKLGRVLVFGVFSTPVVVDWSIIGDRKELDIRGAHLGPGRYPLAIDLLHRGEIDTAAIVTHRLPLSDYEVGLSLVANQEAIKVVLIP
jgi:L-iditol 2-dehydrogenase